jgi:putative peptidoglycan lipid II flippase
VWRKIASVGGLTLASRALGFVRDVMMAALLGAGPLADAFMVAFRLPNHFRAIFAEGAFNAAFVPRYSAVLTSGGNAAARDFASAMMTLTVIVQIALLVVALFGAAWLVRLLAPGFADDPAKFATTVALTRITFPYLALISVMTLVAGMLNAHERFAAAAATPILLNLCMIGALLAAPAFPTVAHALAWGVLASGVAQLAFVLWDLGRTPQRLRWLRPRLDAETRRFLRAFGPAVLGSGGVQIAIFADTIIASFLAAGSVSYLYYADRLYQLPLAVIGIAIGTVLLPDLSKRIAGGDEAGARSQLNRGLEGSVVMTLPFVVVFLCAAEPVVSVLFGRGAFDQAAVEGSALALRAYAIGLTAVVALRALTPGFYARGDTATPVKALAVATIANVALKIGLMGTLAHAGLALGTAVGAWVNALLLLWLLGRRRSFVADRRLTRLVVAAVVAAVAMAAVMVALEPLVRPLDGLWPRVPGFIPLALRCAVAGGVYVGVIWLGWRGRGTKAA